MRSQKVDAIFKSGTSRLSRKIETSLISRLKSKPASSIPIPVLSNYLAGELFSLLKCWLDHNMPYPPERMDEIFHALVTPTFRTVLQNPDTSG